MRNPCAASIRQQMDAASRFFVAKHPRSPGFHDMPGGTVRFTAGPAGQDNGQQSYRTLLAAVASHDTHHTWPLRTRLRGPQSSIAQGTSGFPPPRPSRALLGFFFTILFFSVYCCGPESISNERPQAVFLTVSAAHTAVLLDASPSGRVVILSERIPPSGLSKLR